MAPKCPPEEDFRRIHERAPDEKNIGVGSSLQHSVSIPIRVSIFLPKPKSSSKNCNIPNSCNIPIKVLGDGSGFQNDIGIRLTPKYREMELIEHASCSQKRKTICVCRMDNILRYTILGTHPKYDGQQSCSSVRRGTDDHDGKKFYEWFIAKRSSKNDKNVKLFHAGRPTPGPTPPGKKFEEAEQEYCCEEVMPHLQYSQVVIRKKSSGAPAILLRQLCQPFQHDTDQELTIAPGIDPCLSISIAVIIKAFDYYDSKFDLCECILGCLGAALCSGF